MVVIIVKEFVYSDDKVILIKVLRKKKELRKNIEQRMFYTLYFLFIFLRIVELLSFLYFHSSPTCSCWITLFHLVHAPRIERKTLREVVLSITNKRIRKNAGEKNKNGYTTLHKVTQAAEAEPSSASTAPQIFEKIIKGLDLYKTLACMSGRNMRKKYK